MIYTTAPYTTTPEDIHSGIEEFLKKAKLTGHPQFLEFTDISPCYKARYCLDNCEAESNKTSVGIVYGCKNPDNNRIDIALLNLMEAGLFV